MKRFYFSKAFFIFQYFLKSFSFLGLSIASLGDSSLTLRMTGKERDSSLTLRMTGKERDSSLTLRMTGKGSE